MGENVNGDRVSSWAPQSPWMVTAAIKLKDACSLEEKLWQTLDNILKSRDITLPTKVHVVKAMVFPVIIYKCERWTRKKAKRQCFQTVGLEKNVESLLDRKIKPVNPKGNQPWIFIGRTDAKAETPILWPPDLKSQLFGKELDDGKDRRQKEKKWQRMRWTWIWANSGR